MPPACVHCRSRRWMGTPLCRACLRRLKRIPSPACATCGSPGCAGKHEDWDYPFRSLRFLFDMGPQLTTLAHGFKYRHLRRHIAFLCAYARYRPELRAFLADRDALVPVPLHGARRRERGYNQAGVIAEALAGPVGRPVLHGALKRLRATGTQTKLGRGQRQGNLRGAFGCPEPESLRGLRVVLVDDVFTTGATASECARLLLKAGCASVDVLTLARVDANPVADDFLLEMEAASAYCL